MVAHHQGREYSGNNILIGVTAADGVNFEPDDFFCLPRAEERYY
jgi:hypothetical protein